MALRQLHVRSRASSTTGTDPHLPSLFRLPDELVNHVLTFWMSPRKDEGVCVVLIFCRSLPRGSRVKKLRRRVDHLVQEITEAKARRERDQSLPLPDGEEEGLWIPVPGT